MLCFTWQDFDWVKWMPVEVLALFLILYLIHMLRRLNRWKNVKISNSYKDFDKFTDIDFILYKTRKVNFYQESTQEGSTRNISQIDTEPNNHSKSILYIPSLGGFSHRSNFIQHSLTNQGYNVLEFSKKSFRSFISHILHNPSIFSTFINNYNIATIIGFDYSVPFFLKFLRQVKTDLHQINLLNSIKWIFIRPIISPSLLGSFFRFFPFSFAWITLMKIRRFWDKLDLLELNKFDDFEVSFDNLNLLEELSDYFKMKWIFIDQDFHSRQGRQIINNFKPKDTRFYRNQTNDWDFYQNETVLIGFLSSFLTLESNV